MTRSLIMIICIVVASYSYGQSSFFTDANAFFQQYAVSGLINYDGIQKNPDQLNSLVSQIQKFRIVGKEPIVQKAFYTNAYNILVIKQIIDNYPTKGPMEVEGFFNKTKFNVTGRSVTLDELEKEILFKAFPDPRLHFVLVCAAMGCPPISDFAYVPDSLDTQLQLKTEQVLNIDWYVRIYKYKTQISKVFDWYKTDFISDTTSVKSYINQYRTLKIPESHRLEYYEYDWSLNDSKNIRY